MLLAEKTPDFYSAFLKNYFRANLTSRLRIAEKITQPSPANYETPISLNSLCFFNLTG